MTPLLLASALRRSWYIPVAAAALGGLLGILASMAATPQYSAQTSLYISPGFATSATDLNQSSAYALSQMPSYASLATSTSVLQETTEALDLSQSIASLRGSVTVTNPPDSTILTITVTGADPGQAARVADEVATQTGEALVGLTPNVTDNAVDSVPGAGELRPLTASIISAASIPTSPSAPNRTLNVIQGVLIGLILGVVLVIVRRSTDRRVATPQDLAEISDAPLLGSVPVSKGAGSTRAEDYRQLATNVQALSGRQGGVALLVTSTRPGEGTTTTAAGLAAALGAGGRSVLLVDANLRHPTPRVDAGAGLSTAFDGEGDLSDLIRTEDTGVAHLDAGAPVEDPYSILSSPTMALLVAEMRSRFEMVIFDAPAIEGGADATVIGRVVDGALLVVDSTRTPDAKISSALRELETSRVPLLGVVLNRTAGHHRGYTRRSDR